MMIVDQIIYSPNLILYYTGRNIIFIIDIEEINGKEKDPYGKSMLPTNMENIDDSLIE